MTAGIVHVPAQAKRWSRQRDWVQLQDRCVGIFDCPHSTPVITDEGPLLARSQDIRTGIFVAEDAAHVSGETYIERIARAEPSFGDILYSREGTYFGIAAEVPPDMRVCLGQRMVLIRPDRLHVNSRFLRYWLNSQILTNHIHGFRDGSVAERLNLPIIRSLPLPLFSKSEQDNIAETLGALDDKIEGNKGLNSTLEATARSLYQAWFMDYEPVRSRGRGETGFPGMPQSLFDQLPAATVMTAMGEVPDGWRAGTLSEIAHLNPQAWSANQHPDDVEYVDLAGTKRGAIQRVERFEWKSAPSRARRVVRPGDTIVGTVRPANQSYALIHQDGLTASTGFAVMRPREPYFRELIYLAATSPTNIDRLGRLADGAAYPAIRPEVVQKTMVPIAPTGFVRAFSSVTAPFLDLIATNLKETEILASIRDTLLPRLLSGDIDLSGEGRRRDF